MGKLTDDQIRWILSLDAAGVQGELVSISSRSKELAEDNKKLTEEIRKTTKEMNSASREMDSLTKKGKENSDAFKEAKERYDTSKTSLEGLTAKVLVNNKAIEENTKKTSQIVSQMKVQDMTMSQLKQRAFDLQRQLDKTSQAADPEAYKKLQVELNQVNARMKDLKNGSALAGNTFGNLLNNFQNIPGPVGSAISSIVNLGKALWALVANPIGATIAAIVASLMLLYKAFTSTDTGAVALQSALKAVGNVMDVLIDRAMSYFKMLWSIVTFDFKGVKTNAEAAFGGIGKALKDAASAGWDYAQVMDDIDDREAAAAIRSAKLRDEIETLKNQSKDVNKTAKERIALAEEAMNKEIQLNGIEKGFLIERNDAETKNLASKIQNSKLTMEQKEAQLRQWLSVDDKELSSLKEKDKAFAEFVDKNEKEYQQLQKAKSDEFMKDAEFQKVTRRLQSSLATFKKELMTDGEKAEEEAQKKKLEKLEASNDKEMQAIKKRYLEGKISEDEYNAELLSQEMKFLANKARIYKVGSKEYEQAVVQSIEKQVEAEKKLKDLTLRVNNDLIDAKIALMNDGVRKESAIEDQRWNKELEGLKKQLIDKKELTDEERAANETINQIIEAKEKQHQENIAKIKKASANENLMNEAKIAEASARTQEEYYGAQVKLIEATYAEELEAAKNNADKIVLAEKNKNNKLKDLDKQRKQDQADFLASTAVSIKDQSEARIAQEEITYNKTLKLAGDDAKKKEKVEKSHSASLLKIKSDEIKSYGEYTQSVGNLLNSMMELELERAGNNEEKKKEIRKKYAKTQFLVSAAQIIVDTATAVMKAYADLGPIFGSIFSGIIVATGAVQLAIANQQAKAAAGFADGGFNQDGGYTGPGAKYEIAGTLPNGKPFHRGEYFVAQEEMANPVVIQYVKQIEGIRRQRTNINPLPGYAEGGFNNNNNSNSSSSYSDAINKALAEELRHLRQNGIEAYTVLTGKNKFYEKDAEYKRLKAKTSF